MSGVVQIGPLDEAGMDILWIVTPGNANVRTYRVRYHCCGRTTDMHHKTVNRRRLKLIIRCAKCAGLNRPPSGKGAFRVAALEKQARGERLTEAEQMQADYGVAPPAWPVPRAELIGRYVPWFDRAA